MFRLWRYWKDMRHFQALPPEMRRIVFYSEGPAYWVHLEAIIRHLVQDYGRTVCYLSSQETDPGLAQNNLRILPFCIGEGAMRTTLFRFLKAGVMVMTMPDLETFHIKRSIHPVHYVYVHHSIISTHMAYRPSAFDHFDTVFCVGPHHIEETRENEQAYGLPVKDLFEHGYGRLDAILKAARVRPVQPRRKSGPLRVLVAPSWGPQALLETVGEQLVEALLDAGHEVTVRPHPQTRRLTPAVLDGLLAHFRGHLLFRYEENVASQDSLHASDLMISDWSGAALEYAFGLEHPVLFVDVPRKSNNPEYEKLKAVPLEVRIRAEIGSVLPLDRLKDVAQWVERLVVDSAAVAERIRAARCQWVYNLGQSGERGAERIVEICDRR